MTTRPDAPSTPTPTSTTDLVALAEVSGISVLWKACAPWHGRYFRDRAEIWIQPGLTERISRSILAHELGHAHRGDNGPAGDCAERAAWTYAARLLIGPSEYAEAEALYGPHACRLALELSVTTEVIHAWQDAAHDGALWTRIAST